MPKMMDRRIAIAGLAGSAIVAAKALVSQARSSTQRILDVTDFGVSPASSAADNLASFRRAVSTAPAGSVLRLPPTGEKAVVIDTSGGWQGAVQIDKSLTLQIDGNLRASHSAISTNPSFILNIVAPGITLTGAGRIIGDGTFDDTNAGSDETMPGLIRVAADDFTMTGIALVDPPKVGLLLYQCRGARITDSRFLGGPGVYGDTSHFAIRAAGGGRHLFQNNRFLPAADGGMCVQCIMLVTSHDNVIIANHAQHPYEKLVYCFGDRNVARDNVVEGNPGNIPGTNIQGTITGVFRFHGSGNRVENNRTSNCAAGAQIMEGSGHQVIGNHFESCGQTGISAYDCDLTDSVFRDNICTRGGLAGFLAGDGMRLISDRSAARNVVIADNEISGFSISDPIDAIPGWTARRSLGRNSIVKPSVGNGRYYVADRGGLTGVREPHWPTTPGTTVVDGTMRWVALAYEGGQAEIKLAGRSATVPVSDSVITGNRVHGGQLGIFTANVIRSRITENDIDATAWAMVEEEGRQNQWQNNVVRGTAKRTVRTLSPTSMSAD